MAFEYVRGHRLFPAGSACWFAALFGLSALAIRPQQLESLVLLTGVDGILPVVAPPLGMVARVLVAVGSAALGGLVGLGVGQLMAVPRTAKIRRRDNAPPVTSSEESAESAASETELQAFGSDGLIHAPVAGPLADDSRPALSGPPLGKAAERLLAAELATLSPLELVERLGIAMQYPGARAAEAAGFGPFGDRRGPDALGFARGAMRISGTA